MSRITGIQAITTRGEDMNEELDDLARAAADALVRAMMTDSWEAARRRFASLMGHGNQRRMDATRAELARKSGRDLQEAQSAQVLAWGTRLRDVLDDPSAVARLRTIVADLRAAPTVAARPTSQYTLADRGSFAVSIGGSVTGNTGEVYVGVGKVDKRRIRFIIMPINFFIQMTRKVVTAHPVMAAAAAAVGLTVVVVVAAQPAPQPVNLVMNGAFEEPACASVCEFSSGSNEIPHWIVGGNSVDVVSASYSEPAASSQSIDLSGSGSGTLTQTVATFPGNAYILKWQMAGNPVCGQPVKTMDVYWNDVLADTLKFSTGGRTVTSIGWVTRQIKVTANSSASSIKFADATPDHSWCGATLDDVSLVRT